MGASQFWKLWAQGLAKAWSQEGVTGEDCSWGLFCQCGVESWSVVDKNANGRAAGATISGFSGMNDGN